MHNAFVNIGATFASAQNNPSQFETASAKYALLNMGIGFDWITHKRTITFGLYGQNITNTVYIDHLSTLKDAGYYNMGRNIALKVRIPLDY